MCNVVTIKADDSNMRETTDIVNKLNKLFEGTSLVAEIVTKETRSMNGKTSYESYIKIEKGDWMEKVIFTILMILLIIAYVELRLMNVFVKMENKISDAQHYFMEQLEMFKRGNKKWLIGL